MACVLIATLCMAAYVLSCTLPRRFHAVVVAALALCLIVAPDAANATGDCISGTETATASDARSSGSTARAAATAQAAVKESSDWRELLPGLTMGSQLRLRTESRRNAKFDGARPGNDEDYLLSRFRFDLTWEPTDWVTGIVELQDARIHGEQTISETRTPNLFADRLDFHQATSTFDRPRPDRSRP